MSALHLPPAHATSRLGRPIPLVVCLALALAAGVLPLGAQQGRAEVVIRRTQRPDSGDTPERLHRRLQRQLDSLSRVYLDNEQLTVAQRRRVEEELSFTIERLSEISMRLAGSAERAQRATEVVRMQLSPAAEARASMEMARALTQTPIQGMNLAMPRGWIGIVAQGPGLEPRFEGGELIVRYFSYPRIVSVDPSSPAQRAGVIPSDTLIAYNGRDVRENDISITRLLKPNARLTVRVLRDGKLRDIPMTVAEAPTRIVQRRGDEVRVAREPGLPGGGSGETIVFPRTPMAPAAAGGGTVRVRSGGEPAAPIAVMTPPSMPRAGTRSGMVFSLSITGVAGAQMTTITEGLAQAVGVGSGVLVTNVPPGTPASESGLNDGDVIVKVDGQSVESVLQVRRLVGMANDNGDREVSLDVLRKKKLQKLTLRW